MERAETLTKLRGEGVHEKDEKKRVRFEDRFEDPFSKSAPENVQRIILWCLDRDPAKRPTAEELLASDLIPRKIEVEQQYLDEALELLSNSQSDSINQILNAMFNRPTPDVIELMYDTGKSRS